MRSNYCGELSKKHTNKFVTVCGWVHRRRDHGGVIFLDIRDKTGIIQIVVNPENKKSFLIAEKVRSEFVLKISGKVNERPEDAENQDLTTGVIEITADEIIVLNEAETPAFPLDQSSEVSEEVRLKNRTLDLRRPEMQKNLETKSKISQIVRKVLEKKDFIDIETPILTKATPEGARDYLVPSRTNRGSFFALPQSPQLFKQMLMISGFEKYYQIARCFRDEDLRADRQPEFSQLDIESSFVEEKDIMDLTNDLMRKVFKEIANEGLKNIEVIKWDKAMEEFGSDKPDLRNPLRLKEVKSLFEKEEFKVFSEPANDDESRIAALVINDGDKIGRGQIDRYTDFVREFGAKGLAYIKVENVIYSGVSSPILKYLSKECIENLIKELNLKKNDLVFFGAGKSRIVNDYMSRLINKIGKDLNLVKNGYQACWVTEFPMFETDNEGKVSALHHPFTSPAQYDLKELQKIDINSIKSRAYDFVVNGIELGGGSIRIHNKEIQEQIFKFLNLSPKEANEKFGFFLKVLGTGCPPHGGIAFGLDRIAMILTGAETIRDVIAFPKTQSAMCLLTEAPGEVPDESLEELNIKKIEE
jgi:aspartyl-tRNA synthetase